MAHDRPLCRSAISNDARLPSRNTPRTRQAFRPGPRALQQQGARRRDLLVNKALPYYVMLYLQILFCSALYAKCPYYLVLYMKVSLLFGTLYAKCPYCLVFYMQSVLIICQRQRYPNRVCRTIDRDGSAPTAQSN